MDLSNENILVWQLYPRGRASPADPATFLAESLMSACAHGEANEVHRLLVEARIADLDIQRMSTFLHTAAIHGHVKIISTLLEFQADPNQTDDGGVTALHWACYTGNVDIADRLILYGAHVNSQDSNQCQPLFLAAQHGHLKLARMLLHAKADVHAANNLGQTALMLASARGHAEVVRLLLVYGGVPLAQDFKGMSSLDHARSHRHTAVFQILFESCMNRTKSQEVGGSGNAADCSFSVGADQAEASSMDSWEKHMSQICCRMNKEIVGDLYARLFDFKQKYCMPEEIALPEPTPLGKPNTRQIDKLLATNTDPALFLTV